MRSNGMSVGQKASARVGLFGWSLQLRDLLFSGGSVLAIMEQPHIPLGLPGYRALMWLGLIIAVRILSGRGWATVVGVAAAIGTLMIGRSPDGVWGIMQYVIAAIVVDAVLGLRPAWTRRLVAVVALGAFSLVLVGWIAPIGQGFSGGATVGDLWYALHSMGLSAWGRLIGFDLMFGAGAGVVGVALAWVFAASGRFMGAGGRARAGVPTPSPV